MPEINGVRLDKKQAIFVQEIISGTPRVEAALKAGYEPKFARQIAWNLNAKEKIKLAIQNGFKSALEIAEINGAEVLQGLANIGLADIRKAVNDNGQFLPLHELPESIAKTVTSVTRTLDKLGNVTWKYTFEPRTMALIALAEMAGIKKKDASSKETIDTIAGLVQMAAEHGKLKAKEEAEPVTVVEESKDENN